MKKQNSLSHRILRPKNLSKPLSIPIADNQTPETNIKFQQKIKNKKSNLSYQNNKSTSISKISKNKQISNNSMIVQKQEKNRQEDNLNQSKQINNEYEFDYDYDFQSIQFAGVPYAQSHHLDSGYQFQQRKTTDKININQDLLGKNQKQIRMSILNISQNHLNIIKNQQHHSEQDVSYQHIQISQIQIFKKQIKQKLNMTKQSNSLSSQDQIQVINSMKNNEIKQIFVNSQQIIENLKLKISYRQQKIKYWNQILSKDRKISLSNQQFTQNRFKNKNKILSHYINNQENQNSINNLNNYQHKQNRILHMNDKKIQIRKSRKFSKQMQKKYSQIYPLNQMRKTSAQKNQQKSIKKQKQIKQTTNQKSYQKWQE